jgi:N-acetylmuramoyl-L-alanine amidase
VLSQGTSLPVIGEQGDWLQVRLPDGQSAWIGSWLVAKSPGSAPPSPVNNGGSTVPPDTGAPSPGASSLTGKVIVIDPGHGGSNPGAIGVTGLVEKDVVLDVSLRLAQKLRQAGATVIMTRSTDTTVFLAARVAMAEQAGAHAFVSIHANAHPNRAISGTETYYYRYKPNYIESYYLAAHLQNELVKALGLRDIGIKHGNFHVIRETTMPSALVELAFLSNPHDEALMKTAQFRENAAQAIYCGLERFFQF